MFVISRHAGRASRARGLSIIELMVGIAVGLIVIVGATTLFVNHLTNSRRLLQEARLNQDLRAAIDLVTRDLRRAGYWNNALLGTVITSPATTSVANSYAGVAASAARISYGFSRDIAQGVAENNTLDGYEQFVFEWAQENGVGVIRMQVANGTWETITDPATVNIPNAASFAVTTNNQPVDIREACSKTCVGTGCPVLWVRQYRVAITGQAVGDATVRRTLTSRVRVRNDEVTGVCPA